jgi:hypothetical protein
MYLCVTQLCAVSCRCEAIARTQFVFYEVLKEVYLTGHVTWFRSSNWLMRVSRGDICRPQLAVFVKSPFCTCSLPMINWGCIVNETSKKLFLFLSKDYLYRNKTICFNISFAIHPICHLPAADAKRWFNQNHMLRSKDVVSALWWQLFILGGVEGGIWWVLWPDTD